MNFRKITSIIAFALLVFTAYQCGDKAVADNSNVETSTIGNNGAKITDGPMTKPAGAQPTAAAPSKPAQVKKSGSFVLKGAVQNADNLQLFFDKSTLNGDNTVIERTQIDADGNFELVISDGIEPGIYRTRIGAQRAFLVLDGSEKNVNLSGNLLNFGTFGYSVSGSTTATEFITSMKDLTTGKRPDASAVNAKVKNAKSALVSAWIAHTMFQGQEFGLEAQKAAAAKLVTQYPRSNYTLEMSSLVKTNEARAAQRMASEKIKVGETPPDIALKSPDGKTYKLSQLKGKVVLLDFWASWCGPCRKENPNVVTKYNKYKSKGFEVFSVSLDGIHPRSKPRLSPEQIVQQTESAKTKWKNAIKKDGLIWDYHVSDLEHWGSPVAKEYGVSSIPKTFLIGRDGKVAAINPRGHQLEPALLNLL